MLNKRNPQQIKEANLRFRNKYRQYLREAKNKPCVDCKVWYPYWVMDFDHRNPTEKKFTIGVSNKSLKALKEEIAKCDVVCANCHRQRTQNTLREPS